MLVSEYFQGFFSKKYEIINGLRRPLGFIQTRPIKIILAKPMIVVIYIRKLGGPGVEKLKYFR